MPLYAGKGKLESLLTRRVQRHAHLATLFPGQSGTGDERGVLRRQAQPTPASFIGSVVQASLAADAPDFIDPIMRTELSEEDIIYPPAPGEARLTEQTPHRASKNDGTGDPVWRRLEAISKAHREKASGPQPDRRPTATSGGRTEAPIQRQPQARQRPTQIAVPRAETPRRVPSVAPTPDPTRLQPEPRSRASGSGLNDDDWRRLEAISNAHRRKEQGEKGSPEPQESPAPIQRAPSENIPQAVRRESPNPILADPQPQVQPAGSPQVQTQPETVQPTPEYLSPPKAQKPGVFRRIREFLTRPPATEPQAATKADTIAEQVPVILPEEQESAARSEAAVLAPGTARRVEQPAETGLQLPAAEETAHRAMRVEEPGNPAAGGKPEVQRAVEPLPEDETDQNFFGPLDEEEETASEKTLPAQPQPLQEAWNVERKSPRQNEMTAPTPTQVPLGRATVEPNQPQQAVVQRLLDQVQPGQTSDSKVETLPPRKPRPVFAPAAQNEETAQTLEASVQLQQTAPEMQKQQPSGNLSETFSGPAFADFPAPETYTGPDAGHPEEGFPTGEEWEEMVETPAGVFPASLASLLQGQRPGKPGAAADATTVQKRPSTGNPLLPDDKGIVQRSPEISTNLPGIEPPPAVVQRAVEINEISTETGRDSTPEGSRTPSSEEQADEQASQPDIEELARKVYAEVKRKLSVERERNRR